MNKATIVAVAVIVVGSLMALLDFASGPSLNLLAVNSTALAALTITLATLLATPSVELTRKETKEAFLGTRRAPMNDMVNLLEGARDGYTWNRKEIALVLRSAVDAKLGSETSTPSRENVDSYIRSVLGAQRFSEFFSESEWRATKVEGSQTYMASLKEMVTSLRQSLEF